MPDQKVLLEAEFDPRVRNYWLSIGAVAFAVTIVGILLLPIWYAVGWYVTGRHLRRLKCTLTDRTLQVYRGIFVRVEKTVPLDKITDLGYVQGPLMRYFGVAKLSIETAGQSTATGNSLIKLTGIVGARSFRDEVLRQRDKGAASMAENLVPVVGAEQSSEAPLAGEVLLEIRDTLHRIEGRLAKPDS